KCREEAGRNHECPQCPRFDEVFRPVALEGIFHGTRMCVGVAYYYMKFKKNYSGGRTSRVVERKAQNGDITASTAANRSNVSFSLRSRELSFVFCFFDFFSDICLVIGDSFILHYIRHLFDRFCSRLYCAGTIGGASPAGIVVVVVSSAGMIVVVVDEE